MWCIAFFKWVLQTMSTMVARSYSTLHERGWWVGLDIFCWNHNIIIFFKSYPGSDWLPRMPFDYPGFSILATQEFIWLSWIFPGFPQTAKLLVEKSWAKKSPYRLAVVGSMAPLVYSSKTSDACNESVIHVRTYIQVMKHYVRMKRYVWRSQPALVTET